MVEFSDPFLIETEFRSVWTQDDRSKVNQKVTTLGVPLYWGLGLSSIRQDIQKSAMTVPVVASRHNQYAAASTPYFTSARVKPSIAGIEMKRRRHTPEQIVRDEYSGDEYL